MYRPMRLLAIGLLLTVAAPTVMAQEAIEDQETAIRQLEAELDETIDEWREAQERARLADSLRAVERGVFNMDSTRVGLFTIVTREDRTESYVETARQAWEIFEPYISGLSRQERAGLEGRTIGIIQGGRVIRTDSHVWIRPYHPPGERVRRVASVMDQQLAGRASDRFNWWGRSLGLVDAGESRDRWTYRALLTSQSRVTRGCFEGHLNDCWRALGVLDGQRWWEAWYHPHQLRMRIQRLWNPDRMDEPDPELVENYTACMHGNDDGACVEIVQGYSSVATNAIRPLDASARESLMALALRMGGEDAYARLIEDRAEENIREHLAYVAGTSESELIRSWRDQIMAARPEVTEGAAGTAAATLGWIVLLGAIATRSTRWRI